MFATCIFSCLISLVLWNDVNIAQATPVLQSSIVPSRMTLAHQKLAPPLHALKERHEPLQPYHQVLNPLTPIVVPSALSFRDDGVIQTPKVRALSRTGSNQFPIEGPSVPSLIHRRVMSWVFLEEKHLTMNLDRDFMVLFGPEQLVVHVPMCFDR